MRHFQIIALAACILLSPSALANNDADFKIGLDAYNQSDYKKAHSIWKTIAKKGHAEAQFHLGQMYHKGEGVDKDHIKATKWTRKSAKQGHAGAQFHLGQMYNNGRGVPQNYLEAAKWFEKAAEQGHAKSQLSLGQMYYGINQHIPTNVLLSYVWCSLAAIHNTPDAEKCRARAERRLPPDEIAKGQALSKKIFEEIQRGN